jgi:hypothetical protein
MRAVLLAGVIGAAAVAAFAGPARADGNNARVRFVQTVPGQPPVDVVVVGGPVLVHGLIYPNTSPYVTVAPGTYNIEIRPTGTPTVLVRILGWHAVAGVSTTVHVILAPDGHLDVAPMTDLPNTGAPTGRLVLSGLAIVALGAALAVGAHQARAATT